MSTNADINIQLGNTVKAIRKEQKITREQLAERIDVSSRFLASVESGAVGVSLITLKKICIELGVSADILLGIKEGAASNRTYDEIINRINQIDPAYLENLLDIVIAFTKAVQK